MSQRIFDVHVHIYPDKISEKASNAISQFYDIPVIGNGMLTDCIPRLDRAGVTMFAAHSVAITPRNVAGINRYIMEARKQYPDRLIPFAAIHPDLENMETAVADIAAQGFAGFKIHPDMQRFEVDSERAMPMMNAIAASGLPILIHCGDYRYDFDGPRRIRNLKEKVPELRILAAHLGGWSQYEEAASLLADCDIIVDTSSALYALEPDQALKIIHAYGTDNVLFGSDYPMWDPAEELERFNRVPLTDSEREDILWNNAARLFRLEE